MSQVCVMRWLAIALLVFGCSERRSADKTVSVGMTYEEVEEVLGRPNEIGRGVGELLIEFIDSGTRVFQCPPDSLVDFYLAKPPVYRKVETGLYVAWVYSDDTVKTARYALPRSYQLRLSGESYVLDSCIVQRFNFVWLNTVLFDASSGRVVDNIPRPPPSYEALYRD